MIRLLLLFFFVQVNSIELGIATMFHNEAKYLKEWVDYHLTVGVDHFWLYNDRSTDDYLERLKPYIERGIVEIFDWHLPHRDKYFEYQLLANRDALARGMESTKWIAFIDVDEFIVPMTCGSITKCLNQHFAQADQVFINWRNFGTSGKTIKPYGTILNRLLKCSVRTHSANQVGKCILRPKSIDLSDRSCFWYAHYAIPKKGSLTMNGDGGQIHFDKQIMLNDGVHHDKFLRINHYYTRDESFFKNVRLARSVVGSFEGSCEQNLEILLHRYRSYSKVYDNKILKMLKRFHSKAYLKHWQ
ncbi:MAG: glycosyltransferase family 92 protein [Simkaniaceae bacterium]|nr:glycosyltransferase family 92 protein [Simkaniaceae bacterium]